MVSSVSSRVGLHVLSTNRGIGKSRPIEGIEGHSEVFESSRDLNSGLADSSINMSLYMFDRREGVQIKTMATPGVVLARYA